MRRMLLPLLGAMAALAQSSNDSPSGQRTTPPTITSVAPLGVARGATVELTVEGLNLAKTSAIYFSEPGIKARILSIKELPDLADIRFGGNNTISTIDLGPLPPHNQVTLELDVSPDAPVGMVGFRLLTPLGTSPQGNFVIEPYYGESPDREPNNTPEEAFETYLPTILVGTISRPGDLDYYKISVKDGEQIVFENSARKLGSSLRPVLGIYDEQQNLVKEFTEEGGRDVSAFAYRFTKAGVYYLRVSDYESNGSGNHFYRMKVGRLPVALAAFPLGLQNGKSADVALTGFNLAPGKTLVKGEPASEDFRAVILRPETPTGAAFNKVKLALGNEPEAMATGGNTSLAAAQTVTLPVTINGRLEKPDNYFRFKARKGEKINLEVNANRLGSPLDSIVEVLDAQGAPIERATVRCVLETSTTLSERDSSGRSIRIQSSTGFAVNDLMMVGQEILEVEAMPRGPDDDFQFKGFGNQRTTLLDTTPEAHGIDQPAYKVQIHPAGAKFAPNGLPVVHVFYRNDDGGPGYGKDSLLHFTAPADGEYIVKLHDARGVAGAEYAYRLTLRAPTPDFRLSVTPRNPNVPAGGRIPLTVTALRMDGLDTPIEVSVKDLPAGLHATSAAIAPGQASTTLLLSADANAKLASALPLAVSGKAGALERWADPADKLQLLALMPQPDIVMTAETKELTLTPGGTVEVQVAIQRNNEFGGRVPVEVRNLPPGVLVTDIGLNGVLITETEQRRTFVLQALPSAAAIEQPIIVAGAIETRADGQQTAYAAEPIMVRVQKPKMAITGSMVNTALGKSSAAK